MAAPDPAESELAVQLARITVQQIAPEEVMTFRRTAELYLKDPQRLVKGSKDDPLGFGLGEAADLVTPVALALAVDVVQHLLAELRTRFVKDTADSLYVRLRALLRPAGQSEKPPAVAPLTKEQLASVHRLAHDRARMLGLPESKAAVLADAMTGALFLGS